MPYRPPIVLVFAASDPIESGPPADIITLSSMGVIAVGRHRMTRSGHDGRGRRQPSTLKVGTRRFCLLVIWLSLLQNRRLGRVELLRGDR